MYADSHGQLSGANEIRFNRVIVNSGARALGLNQAQRPGLPDYIYRNTFVGPITVAEVASSGPFYFNNNVIINNNATKITRQITTSPAKTIELNSLTGIASDNIVDSYLNLTSAYSYYLGIIGYQTSALGLLKPNSVTGISIR